MIDINTPAFINPCEDEPSEHFSFTFDKNLELAFVYGITERGKVTEKEIGLNRKELVYYRTTLVKKLIYFALNANIDPVAKQILDEACKPKNSFSAFAIAIRNKYTIPTTS